MQELVELGGIDPEHGLLLGDQPFAYHVDRDLQGCLHAALTRAALQHPKPAFLHRELDVLDVAEMRFELGASRLQIGEGFRHQRLERRVAVAGRFTRRLGQGLRRAQACDHVLALGIDQELAVKRILSGGRIAGEHDAGRAPLSHIAEHHGLHGDRRAPIVGDVVQPPVGDGSSVVPRAEHRGDRAPQLNVQILRKGLAELLLDDCLEAGHELRPMLRTKLRVELEAFETFVVLERLLEQIVIDAEHHVAIHLDEAAIGVVGESAV